MTDLLDVSSVTASFRSSTGWTEVLHDVSFSVRSQEIVGIVGESGSGKSTAVRSVLGLLPVGGKVMEGRAFFDGNDLLSCGKKRLRELRGRRIGFVAQNPFGALNPVLKLSIQFAAIFRAHGLSFGREERARVLALLAQTGIAEPERVLDGYAFELSGGMAQRVVITMAIILEPALVIADEPTTALDLTVQRQVLDVFRDLTVLSGRSALIVTHDLGLVAHYCDRVIVMLKGQVVEEGDAVEILANPQHPYTQQLLTSLRVSAKADEVASHGVR